MSEINKPVEISAEELDTVAGGAAASLVDASNLNALDAQASALNIGANGGIQSVQTQKTTVSQQELQEIKFTGDAPGVPQGFFDA